jgi:hypothetical protein
MMDDEAAVHRDRGRLYIIARAARIIGRKAARIHHAFEGNAEQA